MSVAATTWAWAQKCHNGVAKSVLAYLANCANQDGEECYPSIATICERTEHHELAVRKAIRLLAEAGLLEVTPYVLPSGRQGSNRYRLPVPTTAIPQEASETATPAKSQVVVNLPQEPEEQGFLPLGPVAVTPAKSRESGPAHPCGIAGGTPAKSQENRYLKGSKRESSLRSGESCPPLPTAEKRGTRLTPEWRPSRQMWEFAVSRGVDPAAALEEFVTYWPARAGRDALKLDWDMTFKNRVIELARLKKFLLPASLTTPTVSGKPGWVISGGL